MAEKKNEVDVKEVAGWLHARIACSEPTQEGFVTGPGLAVRIDLEEIYLYSAEEPGVIEIHIRSLPAPSSDSTGSICVIGSLETLDKIMKRHHLGMREVEK